VNVVAPIPKQPSVFAISAIALMSCVSVAGFATSAAVEEGRYRWVTLYSKVAKSHRMRSGRASQETIRLLARRPGLRVRELKRFTNDHSVNTMALVALEKNGIVASFRDGLSRRFYLKGNQVTPADALRTRVLLWVLDHPGIWEAQVAKDLGLSQQSVHYHLKKLRETKLITTKMDTNGTKKLYRFADSGSESHG